MKNKSSSKKYNALIEFMNAINKECNVFQDNPDLKYNDKNDISTLKKYYHTYEFNCN